jgi:hypothetical protein
LTEFTYIAEGEFITIMGSPCKSSRVRSLAVLDNQLRREFLLNLVVIQPLTRNPRAADSSNHILNQALGTIA